MLISYKWLKQYVDLPDSLTPEELGLALTMSTVEVEGIEYQAKQFEHMVVGVIQKVRKHENADSLKVCDVDAGSEIVQIVCGGSNVREGMKVILGKIGARVKWHGEGELVELALTKIRGVESYGMICGADEVGLIEMFGKLEEKEIADLSKLKAKAGTPLAEALGLNDVVIEVDNKSINHRPDLWGHYGIAREVAAKYRKKWASYAVPEIKEGNEKKIKVTIENPADSMKYTAVMLDGVTIGPSPEKLQARLRAVGIRPINNIVDITNYVMCDLGQPMHAFDATKIKTTKSKIEIFVRRAKPGETLAALDGKERNLTEEMLVIADAEKPIALAGVIGGEYSQITDATTSIIFESAHFNAALIRKTTTKLGLRTDSSSRFEKSLDPNNCIYALKRAVELVLEMCPGARVVSTVAEKGKPVVFTGPIMVTKEFIDRKIGANIPTKECVRILENLGFNVSVIGKKDAETLKVGVPSWRGTKDITIPEDIIEEIARMYGYGNVETTLPMFTITPPERNEIKAVERKIRSALSTMLGFTETLNYSFVSPRLLQLLHLDVSDHLELANPIASDRPYLRRSLLPNILELVERNSHAHDEVKVYEIGKTYLKEEAGPRVSENGNDLLPRQDVILGIAYLKKGESTPFFTISQAIREIGVYTGVELVIEPVGASVGYIHPGRVAKVVTKMGDHVGDIFELHPRIAADFGFSDRVAYGDLNLRVLSEFATTNSSYKPLSLYPAVVRDVAFVVSATMFHQDIHAALVGAHPLITSVTLFDVFEGKNVGEGKKSMAYRITYQSPEKTLETAEIDEAHKAVEKILKEKFKAEIRV
ncbi:MAG TPA: phenylalanine--tRNA ligase subunit beta [Candidatus Magasanikbacteria bacterium]|nr:phenylalanine--tRNA ligase subunit beta [Candidatus Magasanikbacteria bacterium]